MSDMNSLCVNDIVEEISSVLSKHLTSAAQVMNKIQEEKKGIETILLEIPYVKNLKEKNIFLEEKNKKLEKELEKYSKYSDKITKNNEKHIMLEVSEKEVEIKDIINEEIIVKEIEEDLENKRQKQIEDMQNSFKLSQIDIVALNDDDDDDDDEDDDDDDEDDDDDDDDSGDDE